MATRMQDQYSAMLGSQGQQRNDPYKDFTMTRPPSTAASPPSVSNAPYYHGINYGLPTYGNPDIYSSMSMASSQHDYPPLPAHMGTPNNMGSNNGLSRVNPTTHTITHTATSPQQGSGELSMQDMSSPGPSTSRVSLSPDGHSQGNISNSSPGDISIKQESSHSDNSSIKSGTNDDDSGVPPKKRSHGDSGSPDGERREDGYWEKRKKNNESAKRSREARRMKEEQIALRVVYLEQENLQLRTEVSLLKSEIEKLRCMLYNS